MHHPQFPRNSEEQRGGKRGGRDFLKGLQPITPHIGFEVSPASTEFLLS